MRLRLVAPVLGPLLVLACCCCALDNTTISTAVVGTVAEFQAALVDSTVQDIILTQSITIGVSNFVPVTVDRGKNVTAAARNISLHLNHTVSTLFNLVPGPGDVKARLKFINLTLAGFYPVDALPLTPVTVMSPVVSINISKDLTRIMFVSCYFHISEPLTSIASHMPFWADIRYWMQSQLGVGNRAIELQEPQVWDLNRTRKTYYGGSSLVVLRDCIVISDPLRCYHDQGHIAYDSQSLQFLLRDLLQHQGSFQILVFQNISLDPFVFSQWSNTPLTGRSLVVTACPGVALSFNTLRDAIKVGVGATLTLINMTLHGSHAIHRHGWPEHNPLLLGSMDASAGGTIIEQNVIIQMSSALEAQERMLEYPSSIRPTTSRGPTSDSFSVASWQTTEAEWLAAFPDDSHSHGAGES